MQNPQVDSNLKTNQFKGQTDRNKMMKKNCRNIQRPAIVSAATHENLHEISIWALDAWIYKAMREVVTSRSWRSNFVSGANFLDIQSLRRPGRRSRIVF